MRVRSRSETDLWQLIDSVMVGERQALSRLYDQTVSRVSATATYLLQSVEDAQEIVLDVYLYVWNHADTYDRKRGTVRAWLNTVTRCRAIDAFRRRRRRPSMSLDDKPQSELLESLFGAACGSDDILIQRQSDQALKNAIKSLPPLRRRVIGLSFFAGLSHQQISDATAMPLGSVKSHIRRALASLKSEMEVAA